MRGGSDSRLKASGIVQDLYRERNPGRQLFRGSDRWEG
jgi:hypothetical protein